jgi:uncharacterized protein (DUF4415 family)
MTSGGLSQHGERNLMSDGTTGKTSNPEQTGAGTDWDKLRRVSAAEVRAGIESDPDAHVTDEEFWKNAKVVWPRRKEMVTIRLDADLLEWFRQQRGYQTRINAILRAYMKAHDSPPQSPA